LGRRVSLDLLEMAQGVSSAGSGWGSGFHQQREAANVPESST
jgi:hypothetical protein